MRPLLSSRRPSPHHPQAAGAVAAGTIYVLVHEARRKRKKEARLAAEAPISKEMLLKILTRSAEASKAVIEKIRVEVRKLQAQKGLSDEHALQIFQQNFEHSLDQLIGAIRNQCKVTEKAMDASFKLHQNDPEVQQAIQNMRQLSAATPLSKSASITEVDGSSSGGGGASRSGAPVAIPASLTKDRLREIMTFQAVMLEKELRPMKEELEKMRRQGIKAAPDPQALQRLQLKISAVQKERFGVTDEQLMVAIEEFKCKNDPSFKEILQRIATTLHDALEQ